MTRNEFWTGPVYTVVKAMKACGNQPGLIAQWVEAARQWSLDNRGPDAEAIKAWLPYFQPRPFYTAQELTPMWPALVAAIGRANKYRNVNYSPGRLANALDYARLPKVIRNDGTEWFLNPVTQRNDKFYIVERIHHWKNRHLTQEEFLEAYYDSALLKTRRMEPLPDRDWETL